MKLLETILCWIGIILFGMMFGFALVGCAPREQAFYTMDELAERYGPATRWDDAIRERKLASRHAVKQHHRELAVEDHNRRVMFAQEQDLWRNAFNDCEGKAGWGENYEPTYRNGTLHMVTIRIGNKSEEVGDLFMAHFNACVELNRNLRKHGLIKD